MKVNPQIQSPAVGTANASEAKKNQQTKKSGYESAGTAPSDTLKNASVKTDVSDRAKDMARAKQLASDAPDVREDKIREIKEKIQNKQYSVKASDIADRLVDDHIRLAGA